MNTGKLANESVTTGKIGNDAVTGAKVNEGTLRFTCNNPTDAVPILGGPCLYKRTTAGSTWVEAIQACQVGAHRRDPADRGSGRGLCPARWRPLEGNRCLHL